MKSSGGSNGLRNFRSQMIALDPMAVRISVVNIARFMSTSRGALRGYGTAARTGTSRFSGTATAGATEQTGQHLAQNPAWEPRG